MSSLYYEHYLISENLKNNFCRSLQIKELSLINKNKMRIDSHLFYISFHFKIARDISTTSVLLMTIDLLCNDERLVEYTMLSWKYLKLSYQKVMGFDLL